MREGYWVNFHTEKIIEMREHETWVRIPNNAKDLGIDQETYNRFKDFELVKDREAFLLFILNSGPFMRVRGHGVNISFEVATRRRSEAMEMVWKFAHKFAGQLSTLTVVNHATNEMVSLSRDSYDEMVERYGFEGMLRAASAKPEKRIE